MSYRFLKEIVIASGFFDYEDGYVFYDWERFAQIPVYTPKKSWDDDEENADEKCAQNAPEVRSECSTTHARTSSSTNRRVKQNIDVDIDVDNNPPLKKEKEKKSEEDSIDEAAKSAAVSLCSTRCCSSRISEAEVRLIVASLGNPPFVEDLSESPKPDEL